MKKNKYVAKIISLLAGISTFSILLANENISPNEPSPIVADDLNTIDELLKMSIEELLEVKVFVTSKKAEKQEDAPGTVTSYSFDDMRKYGYYTIKDLASITSGYSSILTAESDWHLETRGISASTNEKHLILVDGIPINHARGYRGLIQEELPLYFAERVEFLRGPASALYGTGAFNGVINVVPKSLENERTLVESNLSFGFDKFGRNSEKTLMLNKRIMANAVNKNKYFDWLLSFGYQGNEASLDTTGKDSENQFRNNQNAKFALLKQTINNGILKGLGIGFIYTDRKNGYGVSWALDSNVANSHEWESFIPYAKYEIDFTDAIKWKNYLKFNYSKEIGKQVNTAGWWAPAGTNGIFNFDVLTSDIEGLTELSYNIIKGKGFFKDLDLIIGANYDARRQSGSQAWALSSNATPNKETDFLYDKMQHTYSFYVQSSIRLAILADMILTTGVRMDNGKLENYTYSNFSPRAALVQKITDEFNLKFMYGTALKAPGQSSYSHNDEKQPLIDTYNTANGTRYKLDDLKPETIQTIEAAATYSDKQINSSLTFFYNTVKNEIVRDKYFAGVESDFDQNINGKTTAMGGELEVKYLPVKNLQLVTNMSYAKVKIVKDVYAGGSIVEEGKEFTNENMPIFKLNFMADYTAEFLMNLTTAVVVRWISGYNHNKQPSSVEGYQEYNDTREDQTKGVLFVDLNFIILLHEQIALNLQITNIFGKDDENPYSQFRKYYGPNGETPLPGRNVMLSLQSMF